MAVNGKSICESLGYDKCINKCLIWILMMISG